MSPLIPDAEDVSQEKTKLLNRLKRVEGQVRGLQRMIEEERDCQEVLSLLAGVRSALNAAGDIVLETYLEKCRLELEAGKTDIHDLVRVVKLSRG